MLLDLKFKAQRIRTWAWAIKVEAVEFPVSIMKQFAHGHPYNFEKLDQNKHPEHNAEGYLRFCKKLTKALKRSGVGVCGGYPFKEKKPPKIGDVIYDLRKKEWRLVDCG